MRRASVASLFFLGFPRKKKPLHNGSYEHGVPKIKNKTLFCTMYVCVIQHRNWPLRPTILNAHGTNASPDGLCTRTHTNETLSGLFCGNSLRVDRARRGNVGLEAWLDVFKKLGTYVPGTSTSIIYHNVYFLFWKKCCRARPQPSTLSTGRPTVSLRDMLQVTLNCCVRPALLMGGRGGSAVDAVVVAPGTSSSVGRVLGNRDVEVRRN